MTVFLIRAARDRTNNGQLELEFFQFIGISMTNTSGWLGKLVGGNGLIVAAFSRVVHFLFQVWSFHPNRKRDTNQRQPGAVLIQTGVS